MSSELSALRNENRNLQIELRETKNRYTKLEQQLAAQQQQQRNSATEVPAEANSAAKRAAGSGIGLKDIDRGLHKKVDDMVAEMVKLGEKVTVIANRTGQSLPTPQPQQAPPPPPTSIVATTDPNLILEIRSLHASVDRVTKMLTAQESKLMSLETKLNTQIMEAGARQALVVSEPAPQPQPPAVIAPVGIPFEAQESIATPVPPPATKRKTKSKSSPTPPPPSPPPSASQQQAVPEVVPVIPAAPAKRSRKSSVTPTESQAKKTIGEEYLAHLPQAKPVQVVQRDEFLIPDATTEAELLALFVKHKGKHSDEILQVLTKKAPNSKSLVSVFLQQYLPKWEGCAVLIMKKGLGFLHETLRNDYPDFIEVLFDVTSTFLTTREMIQSQLESTSVFLLGLLIMCEHAGRTGLMRILTGRLIIAYGRAAPELLLKVLSTLLMQKELPVWGALERDCSTPGLFFAAVHIAIMTLIPRSRERDDLIRHCGWPMVPPYDLRSLLSVCVERLHHYGDNEAVFSTRLLLHLIDLSGAVEFCQMHLLACENVYAVLLGLVEDALCGREECANEKHPILLGALHPILQRAVYTLKSNPQNTDVNSVTVKVYAAAVVLRCCGEGPDCGSVVDVVKQFMFGLDKKMRATLFRSLPGYVTNIVSKCPAPPEVGKPSTTK
eukprot:PhF_6_TR18899/c0_g1_i4/m.27548